MENAEESGEVGKIRFAAIDQQEAKSYHLMITLLQVWARRCGREVEGTPLLREHTGQNLYRGFESLHLRQKPVSQYPATSKNPCKTKSLRGFFVFNAWLSSGI